MSDYKVTDTQLISVANAIRAKTGKSAQIEFPTEFVSEIGSISSVGAHILPSEYQQVAYIRSSGTQYINTGIVPTANTRVKAMVGNCYDSNVVFIIGSRSQSGGNNARFAVLKNSEFSASAPYVLSAFGTAIYVNEKNNVTNDNYYSNRRHLCLVDVNPITNENKFEVNIDDSYSIEFSIDNSFSPVNPLFLFAAGDDNNTASYNATVSIYFCKIYDANGDLVRDFIPCYRKADNVIGMYDLANGVFYTNNGSGTFTKGEDV